ncbi:hypothetical protein MRQ36_01610 [Micromonospora sp. R77]|uniref:hypothetical protein n=1 Tax=Micromonospora sp. R77 TaxID=2925836 RepID=UPI001F622B4D|nr:hypothetical protein [Micromonospora sp. R77]MCI4061337.1 hypothetical protein [Micromonospora sp. R77]
MGRRSWPNAWRGRSPVAASPADFPEPSGGAGGLPGAGGRVDPALVSLLRGTTGTWAAAVVSTSEAALAGLVGMTVACGSDDGGGTDPGEAATPPVARPWAQRRSTRRRYRGTWTAWRRTG